MSRLSTRTLSEDRSVDPDRQLATVILTLLSVAEDDISLSRSLSMLRPAHAA